MVSQEVDQAFEARKAKLQEWVIEHPLRQIQWEATRRCDMRCLHCGSDCTSSDDNCELTESEIVHAFKSITDHFDASAIELVSITGGEPLLRNDLPDIIHQLRKLGFEHISVQTNGNRLIEDPSFLDALVDAGLSGLGINLDGLQKAHDQLRCHIGHFENMLHLAQRVIEESPLYLTITTVVSQSNLDDLPLLIKKLTDLAVPRWRLIELQPFGRAHRADMPCLNREGFKRLVDFVKEINIESARQDRLLLPTVELGCTGWFGSEFEGVVRPYIWHCHAGISTLGIWSNGDIGGCTDIDHGLSEGNVRKDSIPEIWENQFAQYRDLNRRQTGECRVCDQWHWCHGGALHLRTEGNKLIHCPFLLLHGSYQDEHTPYRAGETVQ